MSSSIQSNREIQSEGAICGVTVCGKKCKKRILGIDLVRVVTSLKKAYLKKGPFIYSIQILSFPVPINFRPC